MPPISHWCASVLLSGLALGFTPQAVAAACVNPNVVTTLAGKDNLSGYVDAVGPSARLHGPAGAAVDAAGNVYVITSGLGVKGMRLSSVVRKITPAGAVTTLAGDSTAPEGLVDGQGPAARFNASSQGVAVDSSGNVYIADTTAVRKITPGGRVTTLAGAATSAYIDGAGDGARFYVLMDIALDSAANIYVTEQPGRIRKITPAGFVSTLAGSTRDATGSADGFGTAALFKYPDGLAVNSAGDVFVADTANHTIRRISAAGVVSTIAGAAGAGGSLDGPGYAARFNTPRKITVDAAGVLYVSDSNNYTIRRIDDPAGRRPTVSTIAGVAGVSGHVDGSGSAARFRQVLGISYGVDANGEGALYVADLGSHTVRKIDCGCTAPSGWTVATVAGQALNPGHVDGPGLTAKFMHPAGLALSAAGELFVTEAHAVTVRKIAASLTTTLAGQIGQQGHVDGVGSAAQFSWPLGAAVGPNGTIYIADGSTVRAMTPAGSVSTLAGSPTPRYDESAAGYGRFMGIAVDPSGNIFVTDYHNHVVLKITASGVVSTFAGLAGAVGGNDGQGSAARFNRPAGIAAGQDGSLYVADALAHTIRKISPAGVVTTLAGSYQSGTGWGTNGDGSGSAARFLYPHGIAVDHSGVVYVTDGLLLFRPSIRRISPAGAVTTIAGSTAGFADGAGISAQFRNLTSIVSNPAGTVLHVADPENAVVRSITRRSCSAAASACAGLTVKRSTLLFNVTGGTQSIEVAAPSACQWQISNPAKWLTTGVSVGSGNATVSVTVESNFRRGARTASFLVNGSAGASSAVSVHQSQAFFGP